MPPSLLFSTPEACLGFWHTQCDGRLLLRGLELLIVPSSSPRFLSLVDGLFFTQHEMLIVDLPV